MSEIIVGRSSLRIRVTLNVMLKNVVTMSSCLLVMICHWSCATVWTITMLVTPTAVIHWHIKLLTDVNVNVNRRFLVFMYRDIVKFHCSVFARCHQFVRSSASEGFRLHTGGLDPLSEQCM